MTDQLAADEVDDAPQRGAADATGPDEAATAPSDADEIDGRPPRRQRVSRWDRPPQPRDWRFYVGGTGKVLIALGLLIFGFVAYQLWGTGIETARAQNQLENEFETLLAEFGTAATADAPADAGAAEDAGAAAGDSTADTDAAPVNDPAVRPETDGPVGGANDGAEATPETTPDGGGGGDAVGVEAIPVAVDLSEQAVVQDPIPQPFRGDPLVRLEIPRIGRDDIVVPGVSLEDLKDGPGHYPDTPLPGQLGNAAIAGHRTTYGAPFYDVDQLAAGDEIVTTLLNGDRFVYEVTFVEVVAATDYWVVATTDPNIAELTLTSCHPKYTARDRIVVHSVLNPAKSSNVGVPTFYALDAPADDAPIPGDDPVLTAPAADQAAEPTADIAAGGDTDQSGGIEITPPRETSNEQVGGDGDASGEAADAADEPAPVDASDTSAEGSAAELDATPTPIDAFEEGWFDDTAAFGQIALWALVLALIFVAAYQIAKRFRRVWVGIAVGIVPFTFALFFFYQNVNRLLPAGI